MTARPLSLAELTDSDLRRETLVESRKIRELRGHLQRAQDRHQQLQAEQARRNRSAIAVAQNRTRTAIVALLEARAPLFVRSERAFRELIDSVREVSP